MLLAIAGGLVLASPAHAQEGDDEGEVVRGVLLDESGGERKPVEGVDVIVETSDGDAVDTATSDEEGVWEVPLPEPGPYVVTIDVDSLPEGVTLRNEERDSLEVIIREGQTRTVLFPLGAGNRNVTTKFEEFLQLSVEGVKFGFIIAMSAVGLSLIFGTTGLVNFAHGEIVTFGALMAWIFNNLLDVPLVIAALLAMAVTGIASGLLDRGLWRPLRHRGTGLIAMMVVSIGLSLLLRYLYLYQFGGRTRPFADYNVQRAKEFGPVSIAPKDIVSIVLSLAVLILVATLLQRTRLGKATRAVADNPDLAASSGIDVQRVIQLVWVVGGALAALGGVLLGLAEQVSWQMGFQLLLLMFAGITLGGLGTAYGALVGSFVVGMLVQVSTLWISSELKYVPALVVLMLILLVRPQGILGHAERVG